MAIFELVWKILNIELVFRECSNWNEISLCMLFGIYFLNGDYLIIETVDAKWPMGYWFLLIFCTIYRWDISNIAELHFLWHVNPKNDFWNNCKTTDSILMDFQFWSCSQISSESNFYWSTFMARKCMNEKMIRFYRNFSQL